MHCETHQKLREELDKAKDKLGDICSDPNLKAIKELTSQMRFFEETNIQLENKALPHLEGGRSPARMKTVEEQFENLRHRLDLLDDSVEDSKSWRGNWEAKLWKLRGYVLFGYYRYLV